MLRVSAISLLSLASLAIGTQAPAQIFSLQTPSVSITVGPRIIPGVRIQTPTAIPVLAQAPVPVPDPTLPPPRLIPGPMPRADVPPVLVPPAPVVLRAMTHQEFAACFKPTPGCHEALLIHPGSGCPVLVRFTLPPGCPRVCVSRRELTFDYGGCKEVEIRFKLFGKVSVSYP